MKNLIGQLIIASFILQPMAMAYNPTHTTELQMRRMEHHPTLVWMKNKVEARISKMSEEKKQKLAESLKRKLNRYEARFNRMSEQKFERNKKALAAVAGLADVGKAKKSELQNEFSAEEMEALSITEKDLADLPQSDSAVDHASTKAMISSLTLDQVKRSLQNAKDSLETLKFGAAHAKEITDRAPASAVAWILVSVILSGLAFLSFIYGMVFLYWAPWFGIGLLTLSTMCTVGSIVTMVQAFR